MPPNAIMVLIGGRSLANHGPNSRPSYSSGTSERPPAGRRLVRMIVGPGRRQRIGDERLPLEEIQHGGALST
jgi:hypothetical protein